jgi:hypothetical protein
MENTMTGADGSLVSAAKAARDAGVPAFATREVLRRAKQKSYGTFPSRSMYDFCELLERNCEANITTANFLMHGGSLLISLKGVLVTDSAVRARFTATVPAAAGERGAAVLVGAFLPKLVGWLVDMRGGDAVRELMANRAASDTAAGTNSTRAKVAASSGGRAAKRQRVDVETLDLDAPSDADALDDDAFAVCCDEIESHIDDDALFIL